MSATKRIFISDVHVGIRGKKEWFKDKHKKNLVDFLNMVAGQRENVKDLVLLGDFFENWMAPVDAGEEELPTIENVLAYPENEEILDALKACVDNLTNVFYVNGNHDLHVTGDDLKMFTTNGKQIKHIPFYYSGLMYAEHGSRFAMFNARDKMHDPHEGYPLGYFITRIIASSKVPHDSPRAVFSYVDDLLEAAFTTQTLAQSVIEALMELANLKPDDMISMPAPRRPLTIREIQLRYAKLWDRWVEKFGHRYALHSVQAEMGSLGWFGDRLCKKKGYKVAILGHTHESELDKDWFLVKDRGYANAGHWCTKRPTYVEVDKRKKEFHVALKTLKRDKNGNLDPAGKKIEETQVKI